MSLMMFAGRKDRARCENIRVVRKWLFLSFLFALELRRAAEAQTSLCISTGSLESSLLAYVKCDSSGRIRLNYGTPGPLFVIAIVNDIGHIVYT